MRKAFLLIPFLFLFLNLSAQELSTTNDFADYANPLMGTDSKPSLSKCKTKTYRSFCYTGKIKDGYMLGGTGFWDTFRALYSFLNLVYPSILKEMQEGLVNDLKKSGFCRNGQRLVTER